uniref:uncharacterized protein n=1 Tax=Pristiophorus japonicus TaxID=55135 RepID=UPI00398E41CD
MGGGSSKWKRISPGPPEPGECRKARWPEEGDGQQPGQEGKSDGGQRRPAKSEKKEGGNWQLDCGTTSENRRNGGGRHPPAGDCSIEQELDRVLAECEDWRRGSNSNPEPGSFQRVNIYTWTNCGSPCSDPGLNSTPSTRSPAGQGEESEPLLASHTARLPRAPSNQQHRAHDLLTISTQDIENNNLANGFHINGNNTSPNSIPILYDYSEEELMASIEKEYS